MVPNLILILDVKNLTNFVKFEGTHFIMKIFKYLLNACCGVLKCETPNIRPIG